MQSGSKPEFSYRMYTQCCKLSPCVYYIYSTCIYMTVFFLPQSPSSVLMSEGGSENPTLKDNWDDAEGYYSKSYSTGFYTEGRGDPGISH